LRTHGRTDTREARRRHIYWLIKNQPGSSLSGSSEITIDPIGHQLADNEGYEVAKQLWHRQIEKDKADKKILLNAAHFLRLHDKKYAEKYLKKANDSRHLGELYALGILRINSMSHTGIATGIGKRPRDYSFAKKASQELKDSSDPLVLSTATSFLLTRGSMLKSSVGNRLDIDPVEYAAGLISKLEELCSPCAADNLILYYEIKRMMATSEEEIQTLAERELVELEKLWKLVNSLQVADKQMKRTYDVRMLGKLAVTAFDAGEIIKAEVYAKQLLEIESVAKDQKSSSHNTHLVNIILGRVALKQGNIKKAGEHLIKAGQIPGDGALSTFGPNMALAKELLEHGDKQVVLQYLELCKKFWIMGKQKLDIWSAIIKKGGIPDFGANLIYQLH
jgi:hypothetical protein